jgi:hypothetical protein
LIDTNKHGAGTFSAILDTATFANTPGWLTVPKAGVPEPSTILLIATGLAGISVAQCTIKTA